jgi:hypothetical protein
MDRGGIMNHSSFDFLRKEYRDDYYYFECVVLVEKLILTGLLIFIAQGTVFQVSTTSRLFAVLQRTQLDQCTHTPIIRAASDDMCCAGVWWLLRRRHVLRCTKQGLAVQELERQLAETVR